MVTKRRHAVRHRGVTLIKPDPARRIGWRARFRCPDSGKLVKVTLPPLLRTAEARSDWAARKARALEKRKLELSEGVPRTTGTTFEDAAADFFKTHQQLRPKTLRDYQQAVAKLTKWASKARVRTLDDLTRPRLLRLRESLINEPKRAPAKGGKRGARVLAGDNARRSHWCINRELGSLRAVLGYWHELDLLPRLKESDLRRALRKVPRVTERVVFLQPAELRALLDAALAHDAEPGWGPIAPFVAVALLSGMRLGELLDLDWSQVDLNAPGADGEPAGEIHLTGATKTKRARTVDLAVSHALRDLLVEMHDRSGGGGRVFSHTEPALKAAVERLRQDFGAPSKFTWQVLRRTCSTYLVNAPSIYGSASVFQAAKRAGHSVMVSERHYAGLVRVSRAARTLEAAMQIEAEVERIVAAAKARAGATE